MRGCYRKSISRLHFLLPFVEVSKASQKICSTVLTLLQILPAGHCAGPTSPHGLFQHNNLGCSSWESHPGGPLLTMCMWGLFYTFWGAAFLGSHMSGLISPKCPKIHQCQPAAPLLEDHLCQAAAACQFFELSLEKVLTISAEYSPGEVGSAQVAHIWSAQVHPSVQIPFNSKLLWETPRDTQHYQCIMVLFATRDAKCRA